MPERSRHATSTSVIEIGGRKRLYGYLSWINQYPYNGELPALNGGQMPDLDLVMAFYGGNNNALAGRKDDVSEYLLPAIGN
jgi:hypothetical protein